MARTIQQKIQKIEEKIAGWISDHGSKQTILNQRNIARANGHSDEAKRLFNLYRKILRNEKKLNDLRSEAEEQQNAMLEEEDVEQICANCARRQSQYLIDMFPTNTMYHLIFVNHTSDEIHGRRNFSNIQSMSRNIVSHCLCSNCAAHLTDDTVESANQPEKTWAAFIWNSILSNYDVHKIYGIDIWKYIPTKWRYWWIDSLKDRFPQYFNGITIDYPISMIDDRTMDLEEWNTQINSYDLQKLANVCNKFLLPTVLCPWGCSEYLHQSGHFPFDIGIQRYLQHIILPTFYSSKGSNVKPKNEIHSITTARDDYLRENGDDDVILLNPLWKVRPTVIFVAGKGPYLLTCRDHDNGSKLFFVNQCRQPNHILPPPFSDQLCHACINPRTIKPIKRARFSTSYMMHEQRGSFNGIDTVSITNIHNFDKCSVLVSEIEARTISQRPDINALLTSLSNEKKISRFASNAKREEALITAEKFDFKRYYNSSSYIPVRVAMSIQDEKYNGFSETEAIFYITNDDDENMRVERKLFKKYWPDYLYPCQITNSYGSYFHTIPQYCTTNVDSIKLWQLSALLLCCDDLWNCLSCLDIYESTDWKPWLLLYLTKNCLPHLSSRRKHHTDPFKFSEVKSIEKLDEYITCSTIKDAFDNIEGIFVTEFEAEADTWEEIDIIVDDGVKVILVDLFFYDALEDNVKEIWKFGNYRFELRVILNKDLNVINSRHGNEHSSWWQQRQGDIISSKHIHEEVSIDELLDTSSSFTLVYVREEVIDRNSMSAKFLQYIGGQGNVLCDKHKIPLINSVKQSEICCICNSKKEHYTCPYALCKICACKTCIENTADNHDTVVYVTADSSSSGDDDDNQHLNSGENDENDSNDTDMSSCHSSDIDDRDENGSIQSDDSSANLDTFLNQQSYQEIEEDDNIFNEASTNRRTNNYTTDNNGEVDDNSQQSGDDELLIQEMRGQSENDALFCQDNFDIYLSDYHNPDLNELDQLPIITDEEQDLEDGQETEVEQRQREADTIIPTTNSGQLPLEINQDIFASGAFRDMVVSGHVLLNQCGTLLTRSHHQIRGSSKHKFFLQGIVANSFGKSIPLLYPEAMIFPSIYWKMADKSGAIAGAIPSSLLTENTKRDGFQTIAQHIRSRLSTFNCASSTDPRYQAYSFDTVSNLCATHNDTRMIINRGLTVGGDDAAGGLGVRCKNDSALSESADGKEVVKNLCAAQIYHPQTHFATYTCNQKKHFGISNVREWLDSNEWQDYYLGWKDLTSYEQLEVSNAIHESAAVPLLRNWNEVTKLFITYIRKSPTSPFCVVGSIFARCEYQKEVGNLHHIHLILQVLYHILTPEQKAFVDDLVRASVLDVVRPDEVPKMIENGVYESVDDWFDMQDDASNFLGHICNSRCLRRTAEGKFKCRKLNNMKESKDNTKHTFKDLPNNFPQECIDILIKCGLAVQEDENENGYQPKFKSSLDFFHPQRHIPPTNPSDDINMSPVEGYTFSVCRSMQNLQVLKGTGGVNKYVCKYIGKIDEQNYVIVHVNGSGQLVSRAHFLHNTKVTSSKIYEDQARNEKKEKSHVTGRAISQMEMLHLIFKYPEVYTNLNFVKVCTLPLELRPGIKIHATKNVYAEDGSWIGARIHNIRCHAELPEWRLLTESEQSIVIDISQSTVSIDKITQFSLRPPELRETFNQLKHYFRWFSTSSSPIKKDEKIMELLDTDIYKSSWIDGLHREIKVRRRALPEILLYLDTSEFDSDNENIETMKALFFKIADVITNNRSNEEDCEFHDHVLEHLLEEDKDKEHLPVPVFSCVKPTQGVQFILHLMLTFGKFDTEMDLILHNNLRESLRYCKLIGLSNDPVDLQDYANKLLNKYITEQLQFLSNSQRVLAEWIIVASKLLEGIIIHDSIPIQEMPAVQLTTLLQNKEEATTEARKERKHSVVKAALEEIGDTNRELFSVPPLEEIVNATKENPLNWDAVSSFKQSESQPITSFDEQRQAIKAGIESINVYCDLCSHKFYGKNLIIRGFPGAGKTWCMQYIILYAASKGLNVITTAVMAKRAIFLGGKHWHQLLCIPPQKNGMSIHRTAELAICRLLKDPVKVDAICTLDILGADEVGQLDDRFMGMVNIILKQIRGSNLYLGGIKVFGTLDHTQIQPINGRPFLTSIHILTSFKMVELGTSVRAASDENWKRIQEIARFNHTKLMQSPELIEEFISLISENCTFVDDWNDNQITHDTFRVYSRRVPVRAAANQFIDRVRRQINPDLIRERDCQDVEKGRFSHAEWQRASHLTTDALTKKKKEPEKLLFFQGAIFECTYNEVGKFSQSQLALLYTLPDINTLHEFKKIDVLIAPPGKKEIMFDSNLSEEDFLQRGFKKVKIGTAPERPCQVRNNLQGIRKQYGLKHFVSGTLHSLMGDTLTSMATEISTQNSNFNLWEKGQLVVLLSRTRCAKDTIFVGSKSDTLEALRQLVTTKTQWTDFIEDILSKITIGSERNPQVIPIMTQQHFPFRIRDSELPQCNSGYVYMLLSLRKMDHIYIGETQNIITRLKQHNQGIGSASTAPEYLCPWAIIGYVCGFQGGNRELRLSIEQRWKIERNRLQRNGCHDIQRILHSVQNVINTIDSQRFENIEKNDLVLVSLLQADRE